MKVWVRPNGGVVHDHNMGDRFPNEGREVERDMIIERLILSGSLIVIEAAAELTSQPLSEHQAIPSKAKSAATKAR